MRDARPDESLDRGEAFAELRSLFADGPGGSARRASVHESISHFASACSWAFKHLEPARAQAFLQAVLEDGRLAPGAELVISSYLSVARVTAEIKVVTVISIYDGQIPIMAAGHPLAENALHRKIGQFEDLYGINDKIDWNLIFIDDGDDRRVAGRNREERTSRIIQRQLAARYQRLWIQGDFES